MRRYSILIDKIINYVEHTPENTNPAVLATLLGDLNKQSDWNQNDDTQLDYVKNRPFYTGDLVETVLVEERTVSFAENHGLHMAQFPSTFEATVGETCKVSWDGAAYECTWVIFDYMPVIGNLSIIGAGSDTGEPFIMGVNNGKSIQIVIADTSASHTFSISGLVPEVVKIDEKYLPDTIATKSDVEVAQTTADTAQSTANAAQSTANAARSTANAAQSTANSIVPAAASNGVVGVKTITDIGVISGLSGSKKEYKAKGLNIKVNSTVTVTAEFFGSVSMIWDGYSARATFPSNGPAISLGYQVGTDTYTLKTENPISVTVEKMEYTEPGVFALPYLQFSHILLYSNSGTGKLFKITVDDSGTISATEVKQER